MHVNTVSGRRCLDRRPGTVLDQLLPGSLVGAITSFHSLQPDRVLDNVEQILRNVRKLDG